MVAHYFTEWTHELNNFMPILPVPAVNISSSFGWLEARILSVRPYSVD